MTRAAHAGGGWGHIVLGSIEIEEKRPGLVSQEKRGRRHLDRRHCAQLRRAVEVDADPAARGQARGVSTQGRGQRATVKCDNACVQLGSGREQADATWMRAWRSTRGLRTASGGAHPLIIYWTRGGSSLQPDTTTSVSVGSWGIFKGFNEL